MDTVYRDLMEENGFGPRFGFDFDQMHGVWVSDYRWPGSYGRIAFRDPHDKESFWIRWSKVRPESSLKLMGSASNVHVKHLKLLPVEPDPWFSRCTHCGTYGLPIQYANRSTYGDIVGITHTPLDTWLE